MGTKRKWLLEEISYNGHPQEVVVINDTPTPPPDSPQKHAHRDSVDTLIVIDETPTTPPETPQDGDILHTATRGKNAAKRQRTMDKHFKLPQHSTALQAPYDDSEGHYIVAPNESLTPRYKIMRLLGQGTFGKVVECYDRVRRCYCAIKIIRAVQKYRDASKVEIRVLTTLKENDPLNMNQCIHLLEWFDYRNHICMVFELFDRSVYDYLKLNNFRPFPLDHIQQFAKQLLGSVAFLRDLRVIHTDLKPENILLVNHTTVLQETGYRSPTHVLEDPSIRLIDFGSATFADDYHSKIVSTRHYRAPEIILGMGWSYSCDVWSIGCILIELFTGEALFQTHENLEHLAMMEKALGPIPLLIQRKASREGRTFFTKENSLNYPNKATSRQSLAYVDAIQPLSTIVRPITKFTREFLDLLLKMLLYEPNSRITAREALQHPFLTLPIDEFDDPVESTISSSSV